MGYWYSISIKISFLLLVHSSKILYIRKTIFLPTWNSDNLGYIQQIRNILLHFHYFLSSGWFKEKPELCFTQSIKKGLRNDLLHSIIWITDNLHTWFSNFILWSTINFISEAIYWGCGLPVCCCCCWCCHAAYAAAYCCCCWENCCAYCW